MTELATIEQALELVLAHTRPLAAEELPLAAAAGRVLAEPACSSVDLPPFASSAMDGYAIRAADAPGPLRVVGRVAAGRPATATLDAGAAMAIATGGLVPVGADTVVPIEAVVEQDDRSVLVPPDVVPGAHIRPAGGDVRAGAEVVPAGSVLGAAQIGALAAAGVARVSCARRPVVRVLPTGSELREPGEPLRPGEIYESNGTMLAAALAAAGAAVERLPVVGDDEEQHRRAIAAGLDADVLVTTGGVSVGPHDLVRRVEAELGVEELLWGVAVRPGKPVSFGVRGETLVFGLPGNPVSSLVGAFLFVRPALLALQGAAAPGPQWLVGLLAEDVARSPRRDELLRVRTEPAPEGVRLRPLSGQESHMIVRSAAADALARLPRGEGVVPAGAAVRYLRLD